MAVLGLVGRDAHAGQSVALHLTGTVPARCSLAVAAGGSANFADLTKGARNAFIATINETRQRAPYEVTIETVNGATGQAGGDAALRQVGGSADHLGYALTYGGHPVRFNARGLAVVTRSTQKTAAHGVDRDVMVTFPASGHLGTGVYSDTLVVAISVE